jgi:hypothetical protein
MLYTYVDKDHYWSGSLPTLYDQDVKESYLGAAMYSQINTEDNTKLNSRETKIQKRITKDKPFKSMHICLGTDIDIKIMKENPRDVSTQMNEHILCTLKLYHDGLLEVSPGFGGVTTESQAGTFIYIYMYRCIYLFMFMYVCMYVCMCLYTFLCICICIYMHVCIYVFIS